jgi:DNA uptake protein ComE-like DNA-binding protein
MRKLQTRISLAIVVVLVFAWFSAAWAEDSPKININTAAADELMPGIGPKTFEANKNRIAVE